MKKAIKVRNINIKKVHRIWKENNLQVKCFTRKKRNFSTYKGKVGKVAPNRLKRRFETNVIHQKITTDTTEFKYYEINDDAILIDSSEMTIDEVVEKMISLV